VANAGLMLPVRLGQRLQIEGLVDEIVDLGERPGAARPGRKVLSLVHAMLLGADSIDDCTVLRAGHTEAVLGHQAMPPRRWGRSCARLPSGMSLSSTRFSPQQLARSWSAGAGPGGELLVIDIDSFVGEVHGHAKHGAGSGYSGQLGYPPLMANRADTAEVLHVRQRQGQANTQRARCAFCQELIPRVRRGGAQGEILVRADSEFQTRKVWAYLQKQGLPVLDRGAAGQGRAGPDRLELAVDLVYGGSLCAEAARSAKPDVQTEEFASSESQLGRTVPPRVAVNPGAGAAQQTPVVLRERTGETARSSGQRAAVEPGGGRTRCEVDDMVSGVVLDAQLDAPRTVRREDRRLQGDSTPERLFDLRARLVKVDAANANIGPDHAVSAGPVSLRDRVPRRDRNYGQPSGTICP